MDLRSPKFRWAANQANIQETSQRQEREHAFTRISGSMRLDGDKVVTAGAANPVKMGFGYMMSVGGTNEVSEFAWEEMQQSSGGAQKK